MTEETVENLKWLGKLLVAVLVGAVLYLLVPLHLLQHYVLFVIHWLH